MSELTEIGHQSVVLDAAIFACFNPPPDVLDRIVTVSRRVTAVVVVDDCSTESCADFYAPLARHDNVSVVSKPRNSGIAHSLNIGFSALLAQEARSVVTFDQDTTVDDVLLEHLGTAVAELDKTHPSWGIVGPGSVDGFSYGGNRSRSLRPVHELIQSSAVFNAAALEACGLADESLVIDSVDRDLCMRLRARGFGVYADERIALTHPIGEGNSINFLGRRLSSTNHSATRRYYMTRNGLEMFRRYGRAEKRWAARAFVWLLVSVVLSLTVADHRIATLRATVCGVLDFAHRRFGPLSTERLAAW